MQTGNHLVIRSFVVLVFVAVGTFGCSAAPAQPETSNLLGPTYTALSETDAIDLVEETYGAFVAVADQVLADGGKKPERLGAVATGSALTSAESDAHDFMVSKVHSVGKTKISNVTIQSYGSSSELSNDLYAYLCEDVSEIDVIDENGKSLVAPDRQPRQAFEVALSDDDSDGDYLVSSRETWQGAGVCV